MIRNTAVTVCGPLNVNKLGVTYVFGFGKHVKQNNEASQQRGAGSAILE